MWALAARALVALSAFSFAGSLVSIHKSTLAFCDLKYCDWRPNVSPICTPGRVNLKLDQSLNKPDGIASENWEPVSRAVQSSGDLHFIVVSQKADIHGHAWSSRHCMPCWFEDGSSIVKLERDSHHTREVVFERGKGNRNHRDAIEPFGIEAWCGDLTLLDDRRKSIKNSALYAGIGGRERCGSTSGILGNSPKVVVGIWQTVISSRSVKDMALFSDFTERLKAIHIACGPSYHPISGYQNSVTREHDGDGRTVQRGKQQDTSNCEEPRFMRRNDKGVYWGELHAAGQQVEVIVTTDIDVSCDRRHWFHLLGRQCLRHERPFYSGGNQ